MTKILIAEDERALSSALIKKLQTEGYDVTKSTDGATAIKLLWENQYDLALVDLIMPNVDGFEVLEAMLRMNNKTPIVIFTNLSQDTDRKRVMDLGAVGFYVKSDTPIYDVPKIIKKHVGSDRPGTALIG